MNDIEEIRLTVRKYEQAIHTQEEAEFRALWTGKDTDTMISVRTVFCGPDSIYNDFLIGGIRANYTKIDLIEDSEPEVHLLNENTAAVIFRYHTECIRREDGSEYGISGVETQILQKTGEGWKINHIHYSK